MIKLINLLLLLKLYTIQDTHYNIANKTSQIIKIIKNQKYSMKI